MFRDRQGNVDAVIIVAFMVGALAALTIVTLIGGEFLAMLMRPDHRFDVQGLGVAVGATLGGTGGMLAGFAGYWASDAYNARETPKL